MPDFYIVTDAPLITADNPAEAGRLHAEKVGITAGAVLVAKGAKWVDITTTPGTVSAEARL